MINDVPTQASLQGLTSTNKYQYKQTAQSLAPPIKQKSSSWPGISGSDPIDHRFS